MLSSVDDGILARPTGLAPISVEDAPNRYRVALACWVKTLLGWGLFVSGLHRLLFRGRAVIVLFHRVDDRYQGNPITRTRAEFERFIRFFRQYFDVVTLSELLEALRSGQDLSGKLVVTFDDGYRDNAEVAAPIMERHGVRGCFFVATDFIGTDATPWWDLDGNIESEWMSWDQVRQLRRAGHEIGAHTETHADLGITVGEAAHAEIAEGRARLERELGEPVTLFAYPFGARRQLTKGNLALVKAAGFQCCLSAFGGIVPQGCDPYDLQRTPMSPWFVTPYQFGFDLLTNSTGGEQA